MTRNILYIHGAYASPTTFSYMIDQFPEHRAVFAEYDCLTTSVDEIVSVLKAKAEEHFGNESYSVVAHSLGGVVAVKLAASGEPVEQIFTMSTPFGGSSTATFLKMVFFQTPVFSDINPHGTTIKGVLNTEVTVPVKSVVSTGGGSPLMREANDGVVTVASQTRLEGPEYHEVDLNHFEVVLDKSVADLARNFLFAEEIEVAA